MVSDLCARPWVIVGCGYTGVRLAARLASAGAKVVATRRSEEGLSTLREALPASVELQRADLDDLPSLEAAICEDAIVVDSVPPAPGEPAGERNLVCAARRRGAARIVYLSSTGVYPRAGGAWIDEDSPVEPLGSRGARRLAAERALLAAAREAGVEAVSLRIAGIYGPGRGVHARLRAGSYRVVGAGDTYVSRIHVDDLVTVIIAAGTAEPLVRDVYVVADDEPTTSRALADGVAAMLGFPPPPSVPLDDVSADARAMLAANRRIANRRLKEELGVTLTYPSWREGIAQAIEEDLGGELSFRGPAS